MVWPIPTLPTNRTNDTPSLDTHAADHNDANAAINELAPRVAALGLSLIQRITATAGQTTITFAAIPQTFESLRILTSFKGATSNGGTLVRFNNDSTASYDELLTIRRNSLGTSGTLSNAEGSTGAGAPACGTDGCHGEIAIPAYRSLFRKGIMSTYIMFNLASPWTEARTSQAAWRKSDPITSLSLTTNFGGGLAAGSVFALYGMP